MQICPHENAMAFLQRAQPWLLRAEPEHNLILGIADEHRTSRSPNAATPYWATIEDDGTVAGCALRTPPYNVVITQLPDAAVALLIADIGDVFESIPGVTGPTDEAGQFAEAWCARTGQAPSVNHRMRIHALTEVRFPTSPARGELRQATEDDVELARNWGAGFVHDTGIRHDSSDVAERLLHAGKLFFWDDDGPVCMAGASRETPNGVCISAVYTPPDRRRRGYATAAVAELSQRLLDSGKRFCCLFTDLANPTSNAIYRSIGYLPIRDTIDIGFD